MLVHDKLYIGGSWVAPDRTGTIAVVSPTTERVVARSAIVGPPDRCIEWFRALAALGIDRFVVTGATFGADPTQPAAPPGCCVTTFCPPCERERRHERPRPDHPRRHRRGRHRRTRPGGRRGGPGRPDQRGGPGGRHRPPDHRRRRADRHPGVRRIHAHYDGQATWSDRLTPSSWHGATTVVGGNCGVGFAPVRPSGRHEDAPRPSAAARAAMDRLDALCADERFHVAMTLQPGDMQFVNNYHVLHARDAYQDDRENGRIRHLKRLWLETELLTDDEKPERFRLGRTDRWWSRQGRTKSELAV